MTDGNLSFNYHLKIFQTFITDILSILIVIFLPNSSMAIFDRDWPSLTENVSFEMRKYRNNTIHLLHEKIMQLLTDQRDSFPCLFLLLDVVVYYLGK